MQRQWCWAHRQALLGGSYEDMYRSSRLISLLMQGVRLRFLSRDYAQVTQDKAKGLGLVTKVRPGRKSLNGQVADWLLVPEPQRRPCSACGREVAMRTKASQKARARHKCPHGHWCISGEKAGGLGGWNPGGPAHKSRCEECWQAAREKGGN